LWFSQTVEDILRISFLLRPPVLVIHNHPVIPHLILQADPEVMQPADVVT